MMKFQNSENFSNNISTNNGENNFIEIEEKVRYSETDKMGIAHNKIYFEWFEIGRTEFCRQKNIPYRNIEEQGYYFVVVEAFCKYKKSLRYDEKFVIRIYLKEITPKKAVFDYELLTRGEKKIVATGYTVHIVTNAKAKTCSLPPHIIERLKASLP